MPVQKMTEEQLLGEVDRLRARIAELEAGQTDQAQAASETLYSALFEHNPVQTLVVDHEGRITAFNLAKRRSGDRLPELGDVMYRDYAGKHDIDMYGELMECIRTGQAKEFPEQQYGDRFLSATIAPFPNGAIITSQDITERKQAEEALRESEARYSALFERSLDAVYIHDLEGRFIDANAAALHLLGYGPEDIPSLSFSSLLSESQLPSALEVAQEVLETGSHKGLLTLSLKRKDGRIIWVETNASAIYKDGEPYAIQGIARDITERKRAEEALREAQQRLHSVINAVPMVLWAIDEEGTFLVSEGQGLELLGLRPGEVVGQSIFELYKDYPEGLASIRRGLAGEEFSPDVEMAGRRWDNRYMLLRDERGEVSGLAGTSLDVTEQRKAEEERRQLEAQMQQAQKLESLGVMAGGIAHDFNNLLMGMLGNADLALMRMSAEAPGRDNVVEIGEAAKRAAELTNQMLAYSGRGAFEIAPIDLSKLVSEMAHLLEISHSKKAILKYTFGEDLPAVKADASQLRQVVMNLITNASEAIDEEGGLIHVVTGTMEAGRAYLANTFIDDDLPEGLYVYLEVSDSGCGMDAETLGKIFDPFFSTKFTGRGLGLAAVLGIVRGHEGAVDITSTPGQGTIFRVLFPACPDEQAVPAVEEADGLPGWRATGTVLLVDDEEMILRLGRRMLERVGFTVLVASDGREAVEIFRNHTHEIDCVLLDLTMPHMDGEETLNEIRRIRSGVPVIISSGYSVKDIEKRFAGKALSGIIQKPYESRELMIKLKLALDR